MIRRSAHEQNSTIQILDLSQHLDRNGSNRCIESVGVHIPWDRGVVGTIILGCFITFAVVSVEQSLETGWAIVAVGYILYWILVLWEGDQPSLISYRSGLPSPISVNKILSLSFMNHSQQLEEFANAVQQYYKRYKKQNACAVVTAKFQTKGFYDISYLYKVYQQKLILDTAISWVPSLQKMQSVLTSEYSTEFTLIRWQFILLNLSEINEIIKQEGDLLKILFFQEVIKKQCEDAEKLSQPFEEQHSRLKRRSDLGKIKYLQAVDTWMEINAKMFTKFKRNNIKNNMNMIVSKKSPNKAWLIKFLLFLLRMSGFVLVAYYFCSKFVSGYQFKFGCKFLSAKKEEIEI